MHNYLCKIEKQLRVFISTAINRNLFRTVTDDCIILSTHFSNSVNLYLSCESICIDFADEYREYDISDTSELLPVLDAIGTFVNELMTGALIYERVYYGNIQANCRVTLINKITKRKTNLRETVLEYNHPVNAPKLILRQKVFFQ